MAITPGDDLKTAVQPIPLGPLFDPQSGKLTLTGTGFFDSNRRQTGEVLSGVNRNRANIVQLETDYTAAAGALSTAYISADAVVASDAEGARAALYTTITSEYTSVTDAISGTVTTNSANITTLQSTTATNSGAIATVESEITAARDGEASLTAKISSVETAFASGDSANASSIETLEARVGGTEDAIVTNSRFQQSFTGTSTPPEWTSWISGTGTFISSPIGSGYAVQMSGAADSNQGITQTVTVSAGQKLIMAAEVIRSIGSLDGAGLYVSFRSASNTALLNVTLKFATDPDTSGNISSTPDGVVRFEKLVTAPAGTVTAIFYAMNHWTSLGSTTVANTIQWREASLSPTTLAQAQVTNIAEAYATDSSATARLVWTVNTSTNAATIEQTAAEGYTDGTWNGAAVIVTSDIFKIIDADSGERFEFSDGNIRIYDSSNVLRVQIGVF